MARQCHAGTRNIPFDPSSPIDARRPCCTLAPRWLLVPASLFIPLLASRQRPANGTLPSNREIPTVAGRIGRECVSVVDQWPGQSKSMDYCYCIDGSGPIDPSNNSSQSGMSQADRTRLTRGGWKPTRYVRTLGS